MPETNSQELVYISPVEEFLTQYVCDDKLALFRPVFDLLSVNGMFTYLDSLNLIVEDRNNDAPSDKLDKIHQGCIDTLITLMGKFGVEIDSGNLKFLTKVYHSLTLLHLHEEHHLIVNICNDTSISYIEQLYQLIRIFYPDLDDQEYYDSIILVSMSLLERVKEVHFKEAERMDDENHPIREVNYIRLGLVRRLTNVYSHSMMKTLVKNRSLSLNASVAQVTSVCADYFTDLPTDDPKLVARELILMFLLTDTPDGEILNVIRSKLETIFNDTVLTVAVHSCLNTTFMEVMSNGKE